VGREAGCKGDTVKLTCNWKNTTSNSIDFPREMCVFFGYTIGSSAFCLNGNWLTGQQLAGAGVNAQDITRTSDAVPAPGAAPAVTPEPNGAGALDYSPNCSSITP
jgi:hypothetical protein